MLLFRPTINADFKLDGESEKRSNIYLGVIRSVFRLHSSLKLQNCCNLSDQLNWDKPFLSLWILATQIKSSHIVRRSDSSVPGSTTLLLPNTSSLTICLTLIVVECGETSTLWNDKFKGNSFHLVNLALNAIHYVFSLQTLWNAANNKFSGSSC